MTTQTEVNDSRIETVLPYLQNGSGASLNDLLVIIDDKLKDAAPERHTPSMINWEYKELFLDKWEVETIGGGTPAVFANYIGIPSGASGNVNIQAATAGIIGNSISITGDAAGSAAVIDIGATTSAEIEWSWATPLNLGQTGEISLDNDFRVATGGGYVFQLDATAGVGAHNSIYLLHNASGAFQIVFFDSTNSVMINHQTTNTFSATPGVFYNIKLQWDFGSYGARLLINDVLFETAAQTGGGTRTDSQIGFGIGAYSNPSSFTSQRFDNIQMRESEGGVLVVDANFNTSLTDGFPAGTTFYTNPFYGPSFVTLVAGGLKTVGTLVSEWNGLNPGNTAVINQGAAEVIGDGIVITLDGGLEAVPGVPPDITYNGAGASKIGKGRFEVTGTGRITFSRFLAVSEVRGVTGRIFVGSDVGGAEVTVGVQCYDADKVLLGDNGGYIVDQHTPSIGSYDFFKCSAFGEAASGVRFLKPGTRFVKYFIDLSLNPNIFYFDESDMTTFEIDERYKQISTSSLDWNETEWAYFEASANESFTFTNDKDGRVRTVAIKNVSGVNIDVSFPTAQWQGGLPLETIRPGKTSIFTFVKMNSTLYGSVIEEFE